MWSTPSQASEEWINTIGEWINTDVNRIDLPSEEWINTIDRLQKVVGHELSKSTGRISIVELNGPLCIVQFNRSSAPSNLYYLSLKLTHLEIKYV
jgi:hypothetical protein